jgi:hypothetical protein
VHIPQSSFPFVFSLSQLVFLDEKREVSSFECSKNVSSLTAGAPVASAISPKRLVKYQGYANLICSLTSNKLLPNEIVADTEISHDK